MPQMASVALRQFGDALPGLRALREAGRLVPFVGAGLSRPYSRRWPDFIAELFEGFGESSPIKISDDDPETLYRAADRVAAWLRLKPANNRRDRLEDALRDPSAQMLPAQAEALGAGAWPLIITTNYDDVVSQAVKKGRDRDPHILGRSAQDCAQVVRSLETLEDPIVWYIQGRVAPVAGKDELPGRSLLDEMVIGSNQYQQAINASPAFRRAFSEVYRRKSLVFIGSGLAESYFVNLISEVLFSLGPSNQPHFALFSDEDLGRVDPEFLAVRLGITPVRYGSSHNDLPSALAALSGNVGNSQVAPPAMTSMGFTIPCTAGADLSVGLRYGRLRWPAEDGCVILSVGVDPAGKRYSPGLGPQARSFLNDPEHAAKVAIRTEEDVLDLQQGRMFRVNSRNAPTPVFLLAARDLEGKPDREARSLASITEATVDGLRAVARAGFRHASMGLLAAGLHSKEIAPYSLIAQLAGIRAYADTANSPTVASVDIDIFDAEVWSALTLGRIPVLDLLSSRLARVLVRVTDGTGAVEEFALSMPHGSTVGDVLDAYKIKGEDLEEVSPRPLSRQSAGQVYDVPVFPGMVIEARSVKSASRRARM